MIAAGGTDADATMTYAPSALGTVNSTAMITAPGICSAPLAFTFTAGDGPLASIAAYGPSVTCPAPATLTGPVVVDNGGNQTLEVTCVDVNAATNGFGATFDPTPLSVGAGSGGQVNVTIATSAGSGGVRAGNTSTTLRCTTNEPLGNVYDRTFNRSIAGTDIELAAPADLDFTCGVPARLPYTVTSAATSNLPAFISPQMMMLTQPPFGHEFTQVELLTNQVMTNNVTVDGGGSAAVSWPIFHHGGLDPCAAVANPGDIVETGSVGVYSGSSSNICSVTPASLPVVLRKGVEAPQ
jgi:hypothetical protein